MAGVEDDGIIEPGEEVEISKLKLVNDGGLNLPDGAFVEFPTVPTFNTTHYQNRYVLPQISSGLWGRKFYEFSGGQFEVPETFHGKIFQVPEPTTPGPFIGYATVVSQANLIGRPFLDSFVSTQLTVRYPVTMESLTSPTQVRTSAKSAEISVGRRRNCNDFDSRNQYLYSCKESGCYIADGRYLDSL